jgi:hypothetical protein
LNHEEFLGTLDSEIKSIALSFGVSNQTALADFACRLLEDSSELTSMEVGSTALVVGPTRKKMRIDAYGFDEIDGTLQLLASDAVVTSASATLTKTEADTLFAQLAWFVQVALDDNLRSEIPTYEQAAQFAWSLAEIWPLVNRVKLLVATNRTMSDRIRSYDAPMIHGKPTQAQIWDESRMFGLYESQTGKEATKVVFTEFGVTSLPMLSAVTQFEGTQTFLAVLPGDLLARVFDRFGSRLLEGNVRGFLSIRGKVNKGMRGTILGQPERFLAFNNGITATATSIQVDPTGSLLSVENLQIVNGGQTTASLYHFLKNEKSSLENLAKTSVAMKLIVVDPELADELVPDIARYSNSQNKVTDTDFFANSPFHRRMEEISKRILAPAVDGKQVSTRWYYERARGSFENERSRASSSPAMLRKFDDTYPRNQKIDKSDLAKYHSILSLKPHFARKGSQKNFKAFSDEVGPKWETEQGKSEYGDGFYKRIVATKIIFDATHKAVRESDWYSQGYLADIVTYGVSRLLHEVEVRKLSLPWDQIWQNQAVSSIMVETLLESSKVALNALLDPKRRQQNVTEWAKSEECWSAVRQLPLELPEDLLTLLITREASKEASKEDRNRGAILSEIEVLKYLAAVESKYWELIESHPGMRISPSARDALKLAHAGSALLLDKKKAGLLMDLIDAAHDEGIQRPGKA